MLPTHNLQHDRLWSEYDCGALKSKHTTDYDDYDGPMRAQPTHHKKRVMRVVWNSINISRYPTFSGGSATVLYIKSCARARARFLLRSFCGRTSIVHLCTDTDIFMLWICYVYIWYMTRMFVSLHAMLVCSDEGEKITHIQTNKYTDARWKRKNNYIAFACVRLCRRARARWWWRPQRHKAPMCPCQQCDAMRLKQIKSTITHCWIFCRRCGAIE